MKFKVKEIVLIAVLAAILVISQIALSFLPNIELVTLLIIIYSIIYGKKALYITGIFIVMMGILHGFGTWWFGYVIIWPTFSFITYKLRARIEGRYLLLSIYSGLFGLIFGILYTIPNIIFAGWKAGAAYYIAGIPYDIVHGAGNYFLMLILGKRIYDIIQKLNSQHLDN